MNKLYSDFEMRFFSLSYVSTVMKARCFVSTVFFFFVMAQTCHARDASKEQFLNALFKGKKFPVTLTQSPTYPWTADYYTVKTTSRQDDVGSDCWFSLGVYVPEDSASVSFDYRVRYHKETYGWAKYATLTCQIDGKEVFKNNGTDNTESATIKISKGFHQLKWNLRLGEAWENWNYFGAIENMRFEGISDGSALPEYSKISSRTWKFPLESRNDTIFIENLGKESFNVNSLYGLTAPFYVKSSPTAIASGATDAIIVSYEPQEEGCHEQTLTLISNLGKKTFSFHGISYEIEPISNSAPNKLSEAVKNYDAERVAIFGTMSHTDNYTLNKFKKLKYLDLRGTDMEYIFNGGVNNLYNLEEILLPASLKYIDATWFWQHWDSDSKKDIYYDIKTITCMSPEPPKLIYWGSNGDYEFDGLKPDVTVYVPAQYLPYYESDPKWNKFKIMPITNDSKALNVKIDASKVADYSGCSVVLSDKQTQRSQHLTIGDFSDYTFHNLKPERQYSISLLHPSKRQLAFKDSVMVGESSKTTILFDSIVPLHKISLDVVGVDGKSLTDIVQTYWTTPYHIHKTGMSIGQVFEGDTIKCIVSLPREVGLEYVTPDTIQHIVNVSDNKLNIHLTPHNRHIIKGTVLNGDNKPISSGIVSVSQVLNGNLPWNKAVKTDNDGNFEMEVYEGGISIGISADKYFSMQRTDTVSCDMDFGALRLSPCKGRNIALKVTYKENSIAGKEGYVSSGYDKWEKLSLTVIDSESGTNIGNVKVEYPYIYILDELTETPSLKVKISSRDNAFEDFEVNCENIEGGNFLAEIQIMEYGDIRVSYNQAMTDDVIAAIYNESGNLYKSCAFVNNLASFKGIPNGKYNIVAIEKNDLYGTLSNISDFERFALTERESYCYASVNAVSGMISEVSFEKIPALSQQNRIASDKSYITPGKNTVVAGNYITVKSSIELKSEYYGKTKNLSLNIIIPDSCGFVPNSLLVGSDMAAYNVKDHVVEIPIQEDSEPVRFCLQPMRGGNINVNAYISYELDGNTYNESIGGFSADVTGVSLNVLPTVYSRSISVSGTGIANSKVEIIDDETVVGQASVLANGSWQTEIELCDGRDFKTHNLHSRLTTPDGNVLYSETKSIKINTNIPRVKKIEMINGTPNEYVTVFDFDNPFAQKKSYSYSSSYPYFTFKVWFDNVKSPMDINDAVLWVKTTDGKDVQLPLTALPSDSTMMIATRAFPSSLSLPTNVAVVTNYIDDSVLMPENILAVVEGIMPSADMVDIMKDDRAVSYTLVSNRGDFRLLCGGVEYETEDAMTATIEDIISRFDFKPLVGSDEFFTSPSNGMMRLEKREDGKTRAFFMYDVSVSEEYNSVMAMLGKNLVTRGQAKVQIDPSTGYIVPNSSRFFLSHGVEALHQDLIDNCNKRIDCAVKLGMVVEKDNAARDIKASLDNIIGLECAGVLLSIAGSHEIASNVPHGTNRVENAMDVADMAGSIESVADALEGISNATRLALNNILRYPAECGLSSSPNYIGTGVTALIDPSGYVYEAVESNRLEGVKATAYFKTEDEGEDGNMKENISVWDASMYEQENPLYTDSEGRYSWDVPAGLWQVRYEKDGYEPAASNWLPVPPPQMDVNISMTQLINPTVVAASAYPDSICFSFSKYMDAKLLTSDNIVVRSGNDSIDGELMLVNKEPADDKIFASKVKFEPTRALNPGEIIELLISSKVRSYAGCPLLDNYSEMLTVNPPVRISMEDTIDVDLGKALPVTISLSSSDAAIGHTMSLSVAGGTIASVDNSEYIISAGEQTFTVNVEGLLPGNTVLTAEIGDLDVKASSEIRVANQTNRIIIPCKSC